MGVVYEAFDRERGARVALKTLRCMTGESLARFKREFRALQDLHHPNLVSLGELFFEGDEWFFTMELVDGSDFVEYVRPAASTEGPAPSERASALAVAQTFPTAAARPVDDSRLRHSLRQLAEALQALHGSGLVHRDVKSSNVRVGRDGRVVLLDFGLVVATDNDSAWTEQVVGTPAYMAPEQVTTEKIGPEADWYAFGVLLFEALTGEWPFEGTAFQIAMHKQAREAPAPSALVTGVPRDLDALCVALLRRDPPSRAKGADVLRVLGAACAPSTSANGSQTQATPFVGRAAELEALMAAFHASRSGQPVSAVIGGESGVGKSALVRRFLQRLALESSDAVVLAGRCYERESLPYKAFDGVVDALARALTRMGEEAVGIVPTKPAPLVKVFPVLRRVEAIAERTRGVEPEFPGFDLRSRAFASLRDLFTRLADRHPLVVVIDDAQWSDVDSLTLLAELLRPPEAPPLLLVLTVRGTGGPEPTATGNGRALAETLKGDVRRIELGPLPESEASELASQLLERSGVTDARLARWTAQLTGGHPLFIDMMMRRADCLPARDGADLRLEDVLWSVIEELDPAPRAILETVAIAAGPLGQESVRRAASVDNDVFTKALALLRVSHLVQTSGARGTDRVEPYHDRVRAAVLTHVDDARRAACHRRIAVALETSGSPDAEALVLHWLGAGDEEHAAHYAAVAGERAAEALAFDRAAGFFKIAMEKGDLAASEQRTLLVKLAGALRSAGRGQEAARAYLEAAKGAPPSQRLELERSASQTLLLSGRTDEGVEVLRRVLAAVGMKAPQTALGAILSLLIHRFLLRVRGLRFKERSLEDVSPEDRLRVDALLTVTVGFSVVDVILGACMQARLLRLALDIGHRRQVHHAASIQVTHLASQGGPVGKAERAAYAIAERLTRALKDPDAESFFEVCRGIALYHRGRWKEAREALCGPLAQRMTKDHSPLAPLFGIYSLHFLGAVLEHRRRAADLLADAERRGDLYAAVNLRAAPLVDASLAADDPDTGRQHIRVALATWTQNGFHVQHWKAMVWEAQIELYVGDGARAYARLMRDRRSYRRSFLDRSQHIRAMTVYVRACAAVASAADAPRPERRRLLREARASAKRLERQHMTWTAPLASIVRACVARAEGGTATATAALRAAIERANAADMPLHAASARHQLGLLIGGEEGRELARQAEEELVRRGVRAPARYAAMLVPGRWLAPPAARAEAPETAS